jgi:DNA invertase Pin-like site-specific DNA recombinase
MADNKLTILYSRLSCEDENKTGESLSIENQKKLLEDYAISANLTNIIHIVDDGISGTTFNREGMNRAVEEIDKGNVANFLCKDISRLSRSIVDTTLFLEKLQEKNVRFIAISDNEDSEKGISDMLMFRSLFNEFYAKDCSKKQRAIKQNQAKNGLRCNGSAPYGYLVDPENRNHLIPDIKTAPIVRKIFALYVNGEKISDILQYLFDNRILKPFALRFQRTQHPSFEKHMVEPYSWNPEMIYSIVPNQEYIGNTVTNKSHRLSYKCKKKVKHNAEDMYIFENTHEPLIDEKTFEMAQKRLENRKRSTKTGYIDMYSGVIFCGDCGTKMYCSQKQAGIVSYTCGKYRNSKNRLVEVCSTHFIRQVVLNELILEDINRVLKSVQSNRQQFIENALKSAENRQLSVSASEKKVYDKSKKRFSELDKIFKKLYEDRVLERISDQQFSNLTADFESEKAKLKEIITTYETAKSDFEKSKQDVTRFIKIVDKYTEITELNYEILHEFIDRVNIFETDKETKTRKIEIIYNFIGAVNPTAPVKFISKSRGSGMVITTLA